MPRYTIDIDENFDKVLNELVNTTDSTTKADVIRRAVASYKYLKDNTAEGQKVSIVGKDNQKKEIILP
jgi:hypothetical protein